jgi:hypothetical protein
VLPEVPLVGGDAVREAGRPWQNLCHVHVTLSFTGAFSARRLASSPANSRAA